jgi:ribosomal protein S24E
MYKPFVIQLKSSEAFSFHNLKTGSIFKLKDFINTDKIEKHKAYLVLNKEELHDLNIDIPRWNILKCEDENVIVDLLNTELSCTGADVSTIQSKIYIYSENKLIFESEISLDRNSIGLQNRDLGWVKPLHNKDFINVFSQFKRYNLPVLIIW